MITVRDQSLAIDVLEELSPYEFYKARNRGTELTSCSPFRSEDSPSFSINLENGQWIDFGASGDSHGKGNFISLLSFLRGEPYEQTEQYLIDKYGITKRNVDNITLNINLEPPKRNNRIITLDEYKQYAYRHPYLKGRGISEKVQNAFKIGYDRKNKAVAFPWFDVDGNIVNVKFRSVRSKHFHYADGQPIRNHLYGIHFIKKLLPSRPEKFAYIVESEIDALYLWTNGLPAVAIGGSNITKQQIGLLKRSPIRQLIIATDNDEVGQKVKSKITSELLGFMELYEIQIPDGKKDVNDLTEEEIKSIHESKKPVTPTISVI